MTSESPTPSQLDKLFATIRVALIIALLGAGAYFFGPAMVKKWQEVQDERGIENKVLVDQGGVPDKERLLIRRTVSEFALTIGQERGGVSPYLDVTNNNMSTLNNIEVSLIIIGSDAIPVELKRSWISWDPKEKKKITLLTNETFTTCFLKGKAEIGKEEVCLDATFSFGVDMLGFTHFGVRKWEAMVASYHNVYISNKTGSALKDTSMTVKVYYESGKIHELSQSWPTWNTGQEMTIKVPSQSKIQKLKWKGTATMEQGKKTIEFESIVR